MLKNKFWRNNLGQIFVYGCSSIILLLLIFICLEVHFNTPKIWSMLNESSLPTRFPLSEESREHLIENSDVHFKYHNSIITVLSLIIAAAGILVTFAAFYIQYLFNYRQKVDLSKERFENQFFHLLDVLRDICSNIYVPNVGKGKIAFHYMFYEYKALYNIIKERHLIPTNDPELINQVAFCFFLNGVSVGFKPDLRPIHINDEILTKLVDHLLDLQNKSELHGNDGIVDSGIRYIMDYRRRHIKYFDGHRIRIIHYFNYILLIFNHIYEKEKDKDTLDMDMNMYFYGELTEHELGLLYAYLAYRNDKDDEKYKSYVERILLNSDISYKLKFDSKDFIPSK